MQVTVECQGRIKEIVLQPYQGPGSGDVDRPRWTGVEIWDLQAGRWRALTSERQLYDGARLRMKSPRVPKPPSVGSSPPSYPVRSQASQGSTPVAPKQRPQSQPRKRSMGSSTSQGNTRQQQMARRPRSVSPQVRSAPQKRGQSQNPMGLAQRSRDVGSPIREKPDDRSHIPHENHPKAPSPDTTPSSPNSVRLLVAPLQFRRSQSGSGSLLAADDSFLSADSTSDCSVMRSPSDAYRTFFSSQGNSPNVTPRPEKPPSDRDDCTETTIQIPFTMPLPNHTAETSPNEPVPEPADDSHGKASDNRSCASGRESKASDEEVHMDPVNMERYRQRSKELAAACVVLDSAVRAHGMPQDDEATAELAKNLNEMAQEVGFLREVINFFTGILVPQLLQAKKEPNGGGLDAPRLVALLQNPMFIESLQAAMENVRNEAAQSSGKPFSCGSDTLYDSSSTAGMSSPTFDDEIHAIISGRRMATQSSEDALYSPGDHGKKSRQQPTNLQDRLSSQMPHDATGVPSRRMGRSFADAGLSSSQPRSPVTRSPKMQLKGVNAGKAKTPTHPSSYSPSGLPKAPALSPDTKKKSPSRNASRILNCRSRSPPVPHREDCDSAWY